MVTEIETATASGESAPVVGALIPDPTLADPTQRRRAQSIASAFVALQNQYQQDLPVRRLFTMDDSDTFHVDEAVRRLNSPDGIGDILANEFTRAGFGVQSSDRAVPIESGWIIETEVAPPAPTPSLSGVAPISWSGGVVTLPQSIPSAWNLTYWRMAPSGAAADAPRATIVKYLTREDGRRQGIVQPPEGTDQAALAAWRTVTLEPHIRYTVKQQDHRLDVYGHSYNPTYLIQYRVAQLDEILSGILSAVLHTDEVQRLESTWRGLHDLVFNTETGPHLKLRVLNATREELQNDVENAVEFDQSVLFKRIYEDEYGIFGGSPYSALLADLQFGRHPKDTNLLEKLSNIAATAHAPLITGTSPALFGLQSFRDLPKPRDLARIFESAEMIKWRAFRDSEDSRYVAMALPRVLLRLPYGPDTVPVTEFGFVEQVNVTDPSRPDGFLWGNAAWALGQRLTEAYARHGWTGAIRGYEGGGLVSGLPVYTYRTDDGEIAVKIPTEVAITDRREKELSDLGFMALCYRKGTDRAAFFGGQTTNKPKVYLTADATANARLSASLPHVLAASRFAHYIKSMVRDYVGSHLSGENVSAMLNSWISQYVLLNDAAGQAIKAAYPLREARVDVSDDPARPGCYRAVVFLRPHFQLEELTVSIRLVAALPPPAA